MLIACRDCKSKQMNILILLVIAMFIITACYVGYYASQDQPVEEVKGHDIELKILNGETDSILINENLKLKSII
jgi:hypothetical protein